MTSDVEKKQPFIRLAMITDVPAIKLIARKSFERICGQKIFFNTSKGIYEAENVTPQVQKAEG